MQIIKVNQTKQKLEQGDQLQIITENISHNGIVDTLEKFETETTSGILLTPNIENYGISAPVFLTSESVTQCNQEQRKNRSGMPLEFISKTASDFKFKRYGENVEDQKKIANAFVNQFKKFSLQGRGLYISSATKGSGKTFLACAISNTVLKNSDISFKFITAGDYIELVMKKNKSSDDIEKINSIKDASLLILDDIGAHNTDNESINDILFKLIDRRYVNILPTIFTSNVSMDGLKLDDRIVSRIRRVSVPLVMPEQSIRDEDAEECTKAFIHTVLSESVTEEMVF